MDKKNIPNCVELRMMKYVTIHDSFSSGTEMLRGGVRVREHRWNYMLPYGDGMVFDDVSGLESHLARVAMMLMSEVSGSILLVYRNGVRVSERVIKYSEDVFAVGFPEAGYDFLKEPFLTNISGGVE